MITIHKRTARRLLASMAAGAVLASSGIAWAGHAAADPATDSAYVAALESMGIVYTSRHEALLDAARVCTLQDIGMQPGAVAAQGAANSGASLDTWEFIVAAATATFCPEYLPGMVGA